MNLQWTCILAPLNAIYNLLGGVRKLSLLAAFLKLSFFFFFNSLILCVGRWLQDQMATTPFWKEAGIYSPKTVPSCNVTFPIYLHSYWILKNRFCISKAFKICILLYFEFLSYLVGIDGNIPTFQCTLATSTQPIKSSAARLFQSSSMSDDGWLLSSHSSNEVLLLCLTPIYF